MKRPPTFSAFAHCAAFALLATGGVPLRAAGPLPVARAAPVPTAGFDRQVVNDSGRTLDYNLGSAVAYGTNPIFFRDSPASGPAEVGAGAQTGATWFPQSPYRAGHATVVPSFVPFMAQGLSMMVLDQRIYVSRLAVHRKRVELVLVTAF